MSNAVKEISNDDVIKCYFCLTEMERVFSCNPKPINTNGMRCCNECDREIVLPVKRAYEDIVISSMRKGKFVPFTKRSVKWIDDPDMKQMVCEGVAS